MIINKKMLKIEKLNKSYNQSEENVIKDLSIEFANKGLVFLLGKSGSGKTTLLNLLGGIDRPTSGEIILLEKKYSQMTEKQLDNLRNIDISFVFQDFNLLQDLNVMENVMLPLEIQNISDNENEKQRTFEVLDSVELSQYATRMPNELSGGQIQRVAIARAMIKKSKVLLADEPTGNLDSENSRMVFETLKIMSRSCLVIVVSHDDEAAYTYGDRVINIVDGVIKSDNTINNEVGSVEYEFIKNDKHIKSGVANKEIVRDVIIREIERSLTQKNDANIQIRIKQTQLEAAYEEDMYTEYKSATTRGLCIATVLKYAKSNMKNHKKHIICTIIMLMLTIMLIMLTTLLSNYNVVKPIENYISEYQPDRVSLSYTVTYINKLEEEKEKEISKGDFYESTLGNGLKDNRIYVMDDVSVSYNEEQFIESSIFALRDDFRICDDIKLSEGQVVITEYIASCLGIEEQPIGKKIAIGTNSYSVIGCIDIGDIENKFNVYDNAIDNYEEYYMKHYYNVVFMREEDIYNHSIESETIITECADVLNLKYESYFSNEIVIGKVDANADMQMVYGRVPMALNEIIISEQYALENGFISDDGEYSEELFTKEYEFIDIHSGYGNYYTDTLNMRDYYGGKFKITGIYCGNEADTHYLIHDDIYSKIITDYCKKYIYDRSILYILPSDYTEVIDYLSKDNSVIVEPSINAIYEFEHLMDQFKKAVLFLLLVLITIAVFMVYYNINGSISNNRKTIGVLRSIGVSKKCTIKIFLVEAVLICVLSCIFAMMLNVTVISVVNKTVRSGVEINPYNLLWWDVPMSAIIVVITFVLFLFVAIMPIFKYAMKPPIEIIRN